MLILDNLIIRRNFHLFYIQKVAWSRKPAEPSPDGKLWLNIKAGDQQKCKHASFYGVTTVSISFFMDWALLSVLSSSLWLRDYVQYWAERGVEVVGWTVNTAVEKSFHQNLLKIGYITDSLLEDCDPHYWTSTRTDTDTHTQTHTNTQSSSTRTGVNEFKENWMFQCFQWTK